MPTPRLSRRHLLAAGAALLPVRAALAQRAGSAPRTRPFASPRFRIDLPEKDWRVLPGGVNTLTCLTNKDNTAVVVVEHEVLQIALAPEEIDANFVQLEMAAIEEREVGGSGFSSKLVARGRQPVVVVDYRRRGVGGAEQVRVYVSVAQQRLFRIVCAAPAALFATFEPTFLQVSSSFQPVNQSR